MADDPIVEEIHRIRDQMLAECGGDFEKWTAFGQHKNRTAIGWLRRKIFSGKSLKPKKSSSDSFYFPISSAALQTV